MLLLPKIFSRCISRLLLPFVYFLFSFCERVAHGSCAPTYNRSGNLCFENRTNALANNRSRRCLNCINCTILLTNPPNPLEILDCWTQSRSRSLSNIYTSFLATLSLVHLCLNPRGPKSTAVLQEQKSTALKSANAERTSALEVAKGKGKAQLKEMLRLAQEVKEHKHELKKQKHAMG